MNSRMIKVETKVEIEIRYTIPICTILAIFTTQQFNNSAIQQFQQLSNSATQQFRKLKSMIHLFIILLIST